MILACDKTKCHHQNSSLISSDTIAISLNAGIENSSHIWHYFYSGMVKNPIFWWHWEISEIGRGESKSIMRTTTKMWQQHYLIRKIDAANTNARSSHMTCWIRLGGVGDPVSFLKGTVITFQNASLQEGPPSWPVLSIFQKKHKIHILNMKSLDF